MAAIVLVLGGSGTGKSFSLRNMPFETTGVINVAGKPFPFRDVNDLKKKTVTTSDCARIEKILLRSTAKSMIVDDGQFLMAFEFMERAKEKSYEKFTEIGQRFFNLVRIAASLPDDRIVYFFSHIDTDEKSGQECMKTIGKMLQEKICMEGLFTIVLKTVVQRSEKGTRFRFATVNNGADTVKSPFEMFSDPLIPNDLKFVDDSIRSFYGIEIQNNKAPASVEPAQKGAVHANSLL